MDPLTPDGSAGLGSADDFETDIPARLDRLPWSRFHWLVVAALGGTWILDGLEVTLVGSLAGAIVRDPSIGMSEAAIGVAASLYLVGCVLGALGFGYLTDLLGRRRLFFITLGLYALATAATALAPDRWWFFAFRLLTGAGIGGEYVAINSAIQELVPARYRGRTDITINGSFWVGAMLGAAGGLVVLDPHLVPAGLGWRLAFGVGGCLALSIAALRRFIPESPRWLMTHGRVAEAEKVVTEIELGILRHGGSMTRQEPVPRLRLRRRRRTTMLELARTLFTHYPRRAVLCLVLMTSQAFFYNAIFFTYALVLTRFYGIPPESIGLYIFAFAAGNFLGPLLLGRHFDEWGRRPMIALTYGLAAVLMAITALLFARGLLDATTQTLAWTVIFFVASAAASAAYLTISESFPLEVRAWVISLFYAGGTGLGGIIGPTLFAALIASGSRQALGFGYIAGAVLMGIAAVTELAFGVAAEGRSLETVAPPLSQLEIVSDLPKPRPAPASPSDAAPARKVRRHRGRTA